ncbi:O-antigen polysaccharide polymerase Wzy family protein [Avibacterium sp. 20-15]|nr:O-antigen polysaccharide polymerase Wzy [Avibacterium sp. 20-15]MCW9732200.1 O-antigen polysaccharide polymerase Wzy family protein [Avibacterium sp. 20-15]
MKSQKPILLSFIFLLYLILFVYININSDISIFSLELFLFLLYGICITWTIFTINKYPLAFIITALFGLFIYSRFFLDLWHLLPYNIKLQTRFIGDYFSDETIKETIITYIFSIMGLMAGFLVIDLKNKKTIKKKLIQENFIYRIGLCCLILSAPGLIYKMYLLISMVNEFGYLSLYKIDNPSGLIRIIEFTSYKLYLLGISLLLSCSLNKKQFYVLAILIMVISGVYLFLGKRSEFGISIIFLIWYWFSYLYKEKKINIKSSLIILFILISFSFIFQYINYSRAHSEKNENTNDISIVSFLATQGVSGIVLPYYIEYKDIINREYYPYIMAPIIDRIHRGGASIKVINNTNYLSYELTYAISPEAYLNGEGVGTSYITELYEGGKSSVFLGMFFLGMFVIFIERKKNTPYIKYLSLLFVMTLLFLPRGEFFEYFYEFILFSLVWYFSNIVCYKLRSRYGR